MKVRICHILMTDTPLNPCPAELFLLYFSSFEAGITKVKKFQLQMAYLFNYTSFKLKYLTNWASTTNCIIYFSDILFGLKSA